jgi:predicted phosphodiesterase
LRFNFGMTDQDLIGRLLEFFRDEGRVPGRDEFCRLVPNGRNRIDKAFGNYTLFLQAAGLKNTRRIDNSVFERDIERHLEQHEPAVLPAHDPWQRTLFIGDTHFPFIHQPTLDQIIEFAEAMKPEVIVQVGDLYDLYSHAKFPRSHNIFTPREESKLAREGAEKMWARLQAASPKSRCVQITGNHDLRPMKRILEVYPEAEDWVTEIMERMMRFDGVELIADYREHLELPGNVRVIHGYLSGIGKHRDYNVSNVVCGHTHRGGVVLRNVRDEIIWELNAGLVGDPSAKGLSYTSQRVVDWTLGWGWLDEYGPRFIPARKRK